MASSNLNSPKDLRGDTFGNLYVVESGDNSCRPRYISYSTGIVASIAGTGTCTASPTLLQLATSDSLENDGSSGIATDTIGNIYLSEFNAKSLRMLTILSPTSLPTAAPTIFPTQTPSVLPSLNPSAFPSIIPSYLPTQIPTFTPSTSPTLAPTNSPLLLKRVKVVCCIVFIPLIMKSVMLVKK